MKICQANQFERRRNNNSALPKKASISESNSGPICITGGYCQVNGGRCNQPRSRQEQRRNDRNMGKTKRQGVTEKIRSARKKVADEVSPRRVRRFFAELGPGLITGAADDDPSGISTCSVTGASFGYAPLWTAIFSFPLMASVQMMCARLGMVTGLGLAGIIRR